MASEPTLLQMPVEVPNWSELRSGEVSMCLRTWLPPVLIGRVLNKNTIPPQHRSKQAVWAYVSPCMLTPRAKAHEAPRVV